MDFTDFARSASLFIIILLFVFFPLDIMLRETVFPLSVLLLLCNFEYDVFFISFIISWNELPYIISNFCWQPDWMWNQLRLAPLVTSVGVFPQRKNTEETIFSQSGCHLPVEAQLWQSLREKLYCILTACFLLQLKSSRYPVATSTTATALICWYQRAFLSAFHAI